MKGSNLRYKNRRIGFVDRKTERLAATLGLNLAGGSINKQHKHVVLFVRDLFPGSHKSRYALRSRVVWWLRTGEAIIGGDVDIHHKNENKIDDRFSNLKKLDHAEHSKLHNPYGSKLKTRICKHCGDAFHIDSWRLKDKSRGRFCSQRCYHNTIRTFSHKAAISKGLKQAYMEGRR